MTDPIYQGQSFTPDQFEDMKHGETLDADLVNDYPSQPRFIRLWWNIVRAWEAVVALAGTATTAAATATTKAADAAASALAAAASADAANTFNPANYVAKAGSTMTGALEVPAGASGNQAPRVSEVVKKSGDTMSGALEVPAGASGNQAPRVSEVVKKSGDTLTGYLVGILGAAGLQIPTMDDVTTYVTEVLGSKKWKESVKAATTTALPACTYANGSSGVGATLTGNSNGALAAIDGVTLALNDDLFVKDQVAGLQNGIYRLTQVGNAGAPFILTRRTDANIASKLISATALVEQGTDNGDTQWTVSNDSITVGTTALTVVLTGGKKSVTTDGSQTLLNKIMSGLSNTFSNISFASLISGTLASGVGAIATSGSLGTITTGTVTPLATTNGNFNHYTNNGAHTLAPPAGVCSMVIEVLNGASAGAITTSGFTKVVGDSFTTTNGHKFHCHILKTNSYSSLTIVALQ